MLNQKHLRLFDQHNIVILNSVEQIEKTMFVLDKDQRKLLPNFNEENQILIFDRLSASIEYVAEFLESIKNEQTFVDLFKMENSVEPALTPKQIAEGVIREYNPTVTTEKSVRQMYDYMMSTKAPQLFFCENIEFCEYIKDLIIPDIFEAAVFAKNENSVIGLIEGEQIIKTNTLALSWLNLRFSSPSSKINFV